MSRTLIRNGWLVTVDSTLGDVPGGDMLIENDRIAAVGRDLEAADATVVDASGMLVMPGLVNAHIHLWQTGLRGLAGNWVSADYHKNVHGNIATRYTPEDSYLGGLLGALCQIDQGATTVLDWCHNNLAPDHSDRSIDALVEAGGRAVFAHGSVKPPQKPGEPHFSEVPHSRDEVSRLRKGRLSSDDGLVTMAMAIKGPDYSTIETTLSDFRLAREFGLMSSSHVWNKDSRVAKEGFAPVAAAGLLGPDHNAVHGNCCDDDELALFVEHGVSITATPSVELQSNDATLIGRMLARGAAPSLGPDTELYVTGDMFNVMRHALQTQRFADNRDRAARGETISGVSVNARQALNWATIEGAKALMMEDRIGSLTPGKQADLLLLRANDLNIGPVHDPVNSIVFYASSANIDTVMIAGKIVKSGGRLHYDSATLAQKKKALAASTARILEEAQYAHQAT